MKEYNGHRSWNAWNVCLWICNVEAIYEFAMACLKHTKNNHARASRIFMDSYGGQKTPDGAVYNHLSVKLALEGLVE